MLLSCAHDRVPVITVYGIPSHILSPTIWDYGNIILLPSCAVYTAIYVHRYSVHVCISMYYIQYDVAKLEHCVTATV